VRRKERKRERERERKTEKLAKQKMYLGERLLNVLVYTVIGQFVEKRQSEENTLILKMIKNKKFRKYKFKHKLFSFLRF